MSGIKPVPARDVQPGDLLLVESARALVCARVTAPGEPFAVDGETWLGIQTDVVRVLVPEFALIPAYRP